MGYQLSNGTDGETVASAGAVKWHRHRVRHTPFLLPTHTDKTPRFLSQEARHQPNPLRVERFRHAKFIVYLRFFLVKVADEENISSRLVERAALNLEPKDRSVAFDQQAPLTRARKLFDRSVAIHGPKPIPRLLLHDPQDQRIYGQGHRVCQSRCRKGSRQCQGGMPHAAHRW